MDLIKYVQDHPELWELENLEHYLGELASNNEEDPMSEERYNELCKKRDEGKIK